MAQPGTPAILSEGRWVILSVVALAPLMVVLDATVLNIALPSAQRALGFPAGTAISWRGPDARLELGDRALLVHADEVRGPQRARHRFAWGPPDASAGSRGHPGHSSHQTD
jgi:hypothetical protein